MPKYEQQRDPYLYGGTNVLRNKFDIKDPSVLEEMEAEYTSLRLSDIAENPIAGNYDFLHLCAMHRFIFQDIFDWAGEFRTIDIEKQEAVLGGLSIEYSSHADIEANLIHCLDELKTITWQVMDIENKATVFAKNIAKIWRVHPFREGNTRTITHFCCQYADSVGFRINRQIFEKNSRYFRSALVAASAVFHDLWDKSKPEYLHQIILDAIQND
jgi:cell filamentation protein